jgi:succinate dehydrogenase cytochrome b556 subunit
MTAISATVSSFVEGLLYRGREGHLSFIGHRLAGLGTLLFLAIHIVDTSTVYFGYWLNAPDLYSHAIAIYQSTPFMLGEIVLVAAVLYHGVNGLKIILFDAFPHWWKIHRERATFWKVAVMTFVLWVPAAYLMGRQLYLHNICQQCPPPEPIDIAARTNASIIAVPLIFFVVMAVLALGGRLGAPRSAPVRTAAVPKNFETYVWQFMRWSGVLLIPLVWIHVLIQDVLIGVHAIDIDYVAMRWATWGWRTYDLALLVFTFSHGMLGLRTVVQDYVHSPRWLGVARWAMIVGFIVISLIGAVAIFGGVLQ